MKKCFTLMTTLALAIGFACSVAPRNTSLSVVASAEEVTTLFSDDFSSHTSYAEMTSKWANQWFDGIGDGKKDANCNENNAVIVTEPNTDNKVLELKTMQTNNSFFYITPRGTDGKPLTLKDYEISFKFKIKESSLGCLDDRAPWIATLNRKVNLLEGDDFVPADGRFNSTYNVMMSARAGIKTSDPKGTKPYFFTEALRNVMTSSGAVALKNEDRTGDAADIPTDSIYNVWNTYKCVVNGNDFDMYLNGRHFGGFTLGTSSAQDKFRNEGYVSIACCIMDAYLDDVLITTVGTEQPGQNGGQDGGSDNTEFESTKYVSVQKGKSASVVLGGVTVVNSVAKNGEAVIKGSAWSFANGMLTFNTAYIDFLGAGNYVFEVATDAGTVTVNLTISEPAEEKGCSGSLTVTVLPIMTALVGSIFLLKKEKRKCKS